MYNRIGGIAHVHWRDAFTRGAPRASADQRLLRFIFGLWLAAFALKSIGADWDIAWHFRFLRDDLAPPHVINTFGMSLGVQLLVYQSWTGWAVEHWGLRLIQIGVAVFVVAIPLDVLNHRLFGLDLTTWSWTHALLYLGTGLMLAGVLRSWLRLTAPDRWRMTYALALWAFLLDTVMFPLGQQEYGTLAANALLKGQSTASPDLLALAGQNAVKFALGWVPLWLYPVALILGTTPLLAWARAVQGWRWTATTVAALYLGARVVAYWLLVAGSFPRSFIPIMLLGGALMIDLRARWHWRPLTSAAAVVAIYYGGAALIGRLTLMPAFPLSTAPVVGAILWLGFAAAPTFASWRSRQARADAGI